MKPLYRKALLTAATRAAALAAALIVSACASAPSSARAPLSRPSLDEAKSQAHTLIAKRMKEYKIAGLSVTLADSTGTILLEAFGEADKGKAFTVNTLSNVGSVSKLFTGFAIMRLAETGKVDLDAPLSRYLPDFKPRTWGPSPDGVTVRAVMAHQSGMQSDLLGFDWNLPMPYKEAPKRPYENNAKLASQTTLCWEPYTVWSYSNLAVSLLALVVESASGMDFSDYVAEQVFQPAGMMDSSFVFRQDLEDKYARGRTGREWADIPAIRDSAAGSMTSSAADMAKFFDAVIRTNSGGAKSGNGGILAPETLKTMWTRENSGTALDQDRIQMLSWYAAKSDTVPAKLYYLHGGDLPPFHASVLVDPVLNMGISLMINGGDANSGTLQILAEELLRLFACAIQGEELDSISAKAPAKRIPLDAEKTAAMTGFYAGESGLARVSGFGTALKLSMGPLDVRLERIAENKFSLQALLLGILPVKLPGFEDLSISAETIVGMDFLKLNVNGGSMIMEKISPQKVDEAWITRLGTWISAEKPPKTGFFIPEARLEIDAKTGLLLGYITLQDGKSKQQAVYPLATRGPCELYIRGYGRNLGTTVYAFTEQSVDYIDIMGVRLVRK